MTPIRPILRYHGGKWRIAPWVIAHFPPHRIYVEPFGGGASVLLRKPRSPAEVYNDLDDEVVNVFRVLRSPKQAARLRELLLLTPWSRTEFWDSYEPTRSKVEAARRTIVRSYQAHGNTSLLDSSASFRARNQHGHGRASAAQVWAGWPAGVPSYVERLRGVTLENRPAIEVIEQQDSPETLFYLDPPYPLEARSSVRVPSEAKRGYKHNLSDVEYEALAAQLSRVAGMVVLSGYRCPLMDRLFGSWPSVEKTTVADGAVNRTEVLWLNPKAAHWGNRTLFSTVANA